MAEDSIIDYCEPVGLLTFALAALVAALLRVNQLRGFKKDIERLKELRSW